MTKLEEWNYAFTSVKESFEGKMILCSRDPWCKYSVGKVDKHGKTHNTALCHNFYKIYSRKWKVFLGI